jgi:hypothetical protein
VSRFYIDVMRGKVDLPDGVALKAFVKTSGDTVGIILLQEAGGFALWREGSCLGTFDTLLAVYLELDRVGA